MTPWEGGYRKPEVSISYCLTSSRVTNLSKVDCITALYNYLKWFYKNVFFLLITGGITGFQGYKNPVKNFQ